MYMYDAFNHCWLCIILYVNVNCMLHKCYTSNTFSFCVTTTIDMYMYLLPENKNFTKGILTVKSGMFVETAYKRTSVTRYGCPLGHSVGKMGHMAQNPIPINTTYGKIFQK